MIDEYDNPTIPSSMLLDIFFNLCEKIGIFYGYLTTIIINFLSKYLLIGIEGIKITNDKYIETIQPIYNKCKVNFSGKFTEQDNNLEKKINEIIS